MEDLSITYHLGLCINQRSYQLPDYPGRGIAVLACPIRKKILIEGPLRHSTVLLLALGTRDLSIVYLFHRIPFQHGPANPSLHWQDITLLSFRFHTVVWRMVTRPS